MTAATERQIVGTDTCGDCGAEVEVRVNKNCQCGSHHRYNTGLSNQMRQAAAAASRKGVEVDDVHARQEAEPVNDNEPGAVNDNEPGTGADQPERVGRRGLFARS